MTTVNRYRLYCETEQQYVYVWDTSPPTRCPNDAVDSSPPHEFDSSLVTIVDSITQEVTKVEEPTDGFFLSEPSRFTIPSGSAGSISYHDYSWPYDIILWKTRLYVPSALVGDNFDIIVDPYRVVGYLTTNANAGDTVLNVSATVTSNVVPGMNVVLDANAESPPEKEEYICVGRDLDNNTITISSPLLYNYSAGQIVQRNIYLVRNFRFYLDRVLHEFGDKGFKGKLIPANTVMTMRYTNNDGLAKEVDWDINLYYGLDATL